MFDIIFLKLSEMNHNKISSSILQSCFECYKKEKINKLWRAYIYLVKRLCPTILIHAQFIQKLIV